MKLQKLFVNVISSLNSIDYKSLTGIFIIIVAWSKLIFRVMLVLYSMRSARGNGKIIPQSDLLPIILSLSLSITIDIGRIRYSFVLS